MNPAKGSHALETRVPPLVVLVLCGGLVWACAALTPQWTTDQWRLTRRVAAAAFTAIGVIVALAGVSEFRRCETTVNPMRPETSQKVVDSGAYAWTRNPMYLDMHLALVAWALFLGNLWGLVAAHTFAAFVRRFQIVPEERALEAQFGAPYVEYTRAVRRWFGRAGVPER